MPRALAIAHLCVLLAVIAFLGVIGWRAWTLADELNATLAPVPATEAKINLELDEAHRLTLEAGLTATEARQASAEELEYLPKWDAQISEVFGAAGETFSHADETIAAIRGTASAATQTLNGATRDLSTLDDSIAATKPLIANLNGAIGSANTLISDPALKETIKNFNATSGNLAATTTDFQAKFHDFLYPPPCLTKWCKVKRAWPYIKGVTQMAEPIYWGDQLFKGAIP